jgi:plasmid stabilization system protein ParE
VRLRLSQAAQADLVRLNEWLGAIDGALAGDAQLAIANRLELLLTFPAIGSPLPDGRRKISVPRFGYLIFDRVKGGIIQVSRIHHAREDWR